MQRIFYIYLFIYLFFFCKNTPWHNPTREELEKTVALLKNGKAAFAISSGMSAISTVIMLFSAGDHIIISDDLYGGTYRIFEEIY